MEVSQAREAPTSPLLQVGRRLPFLHSLPALALRLGTGCVVSREEMSFFQERQVVCIPCKRRPGRLRRYVVLSCFYCRSDVLVSKQSYDRQRARRVQEHLAECGGYGVQIRRRRIRCKPCGQERQRSQLFLKQGVSLSWHPLGSLLRCLAGRARLEGRQLPQVVEI